MDDISLEQEIQRVWHMASGMNAARLADDVATAEEYAFDLASWAEAGLTPAGRNAAARAFGQTDGVVLVHQRWARAVATADAKQMREAVDAIAAWVSLFAPRHPGLAPPDDRQNDMLALLTDIATGASLPVVRSDARRALKRYYDWLRNPDQAA